MKIECCKNSELEQLASVDTDEYIGYLQKVIEDLKVKVRLEVKIKNKGIVLHQKMKQRLQIAEAANVRLFALLESAEEALRKKS